MDYPDLFIGEFKPTTRLVRLIWWLRDEWERLVLIWKLVTHQVHPDQFDN
jgi:hypothetical protein